MSLTGPELAAIAAEMSPLTGAQIQKVTATSARTAALELRRPGESVVILLDGTPSLARAVLVERRPPAPERPVGLQGLLRAQLNGARLAGLVVEPARRLLALEFETLKGARTLYFEIASGAGEITLVGAEGKVLGGTLDRSKERGLHPGRLWVEPPELEGQAPQPRFKAVADARWPLSAAIELQYGSRREESQAQSQRARLKAELKRKLGRVRHTLEKVKADRQRISEADIHRLRGDALKASLHTLERGLSEATLSVWTETGETKVRVPLQPQLSPRENMERAYHLHRRLVRNAARVDARVAEFESALRTLEAELAAVDDLSAEALLEKEQRPLLPPSQGKGAPAPRLPYREFFSSSGRRLWVGRSARDNDALTLHHARGNDVWLHARGVPGSHVIIPGCGAAMPDDESVLDAATLAAHFSEAREETFVDVATTRRKYVQKPKGSAPGAVRYTQEKNVALRLQPERLARLLASETPR